MQNPEYLMAIAEEKSLLRAAEKLFLSQSALSQYIAKLETELKTPLFTRSRMGWVPTAAGEIYIDLAKNMIELQQRAYAQISLVSEQFTHTLHLGISPGRMTAMIASCFLPFSRRFPNIKIALKENSVNDTIRMMRGQKVDLGFLASSLDFADIREITVLPLKTERFVIALPSNHPRLPDPEPQQQGIWPAISLRACREFEFMLMQRETTLREAQDQLFQNAGFEPKVIFESGSSQTIYTLVQSGYAATVIPESYAVPTRSAVYFVLEDPLRWKLFAAHHIAHQLSRPEEYMTQLLSDRCRTAPVGAYMQP